MDWAKRLLKQAQIENKGEFITGTIFIQGQHITAPLYNMLEMIDAPDPRMPLKRESHTEKYLDFIDYIQKTHAFFRDKKNVRGSQTKPYDDLIHRIAFSFTLGLPQSYGITDLEKLKEEAKEQKTEHDKQIWSPMLRIIRQDFIDAGLGWRWQLADRRQTWRTEQLLATKHGFEPRKYLFPSHHSAAADKAKDDKLKAAKAEAEAEQQRLNRERQEREKKQEQARKEIHSRVESKIGNVLLWMMDMGYCEKHKLVGNRVAMNMFKNLGTFPTNDARQGRLIPTLEFIVSFLEIHQELPEIFFDCLHLASREQRFYDTPEYKLLTKYLETNGLTRENRTLKKAS